MKVVLSTIGRFHSFDLARELHSRHSLPAVFTSYPAFKLRHERLPSAMACSCPVIATDHNGAEDLFEDGNDTSIAPVSGRGSWHEYGSRALTAFESLLT